MSAPEHNVHGENVVVQSLLGHWRQARVGCGTGRVAIELARHGCILTGVDAGAESPPAPAV